MQIAGGSQWPWVCRFPRKQMEAAYVADPEDGLEPEALAAGGSEGAFTHFARRAEVAHGAHVTLGEPAPPRSHVRIS
jgi:hypothetical protein